MINACRDEYSSGLYGFLGHVGITILNVNLMHDNSGKYNYAAGFGRFVAPTSGRFAFPYSGDIVVIDRHYLYPKTIFIPGMGTILLPRNPFPGPSINSIIDTLCGSRSS